LHVRNLHSQSDAQTDMKPTASLNHIALYVVDLKTSADFYQHVIGLDTIPEPFHDGRHAWFNIGPKLSLHLIQGATSKKTIEKDSHICFTVPSVDAFTKILSKHDVGYENLAGEKNTITKRVDGVKQIYFKDPDGYWIEVNDARE
jgi:lactoylglutathione lyase